MSWDVNAGWLTIAAAGNKIWPMAEKTGVPWQLQMFRKSLKKKMKVRALKKFLGHSASRNCLLVTCGDNNGAINYHLRAAGGNWAWAEFENEARADM